MMIVTSESNTWMSEDAYGYPGSDTDENKKNILIVDDINDTGATFNWIKEDWESQLFALDPMIIGKVYGVIMLCCSHR